MWLLLVLALGAVSCASVDDPGKEPDLATAPLVGTACDEAAPCDGEELCCSGVCVDPTADGANCGACGAACPTSCVAGACGCADPTSLGGPAVSISSGFEHACALLSDGTVKCWGVNGYGNLGDGTSTNRLAPASVCGLGGTVISISGGAEHTCAVLGDGSVKCWGTNAYGQLGDGTTAQQLTPVSVIDLGGTAVSIASGWYHTCALLSDGAVKCWGANEFGGLGDGTMTQSLAPVSVAGDPGGPAVAISAGAWHTCALIDDGTIKCWGANFFGQLGDGTPTNRLTPVAVSGLGGAAVSMETGDFHTCAVLSDGALKCWGFNQFGQLGDGTDVDRATPVSVIGLGGTVDAVSGGLYHTCAVLSDGALKCWGQNQLGQLGDGTRTDQYSPAPVAGDPGVAASISGGAWHTCALLSDGSVKCWGDNSLGQLGDGTGTEQLTPVSVLAIP